MTPRVELIYDSNCPNVPGARTALLRAFAEARVTATWTEWERSSPASPPHVRRYGSPTILVNGQDVAGQASHEEADSCRVYGHDAGALLGVPPASRIVAALRKDDAASVVATPQIKSGPWSVLVGLPGIGVSLLPVGACPACWPVYAGLLASLGLSFLTDAAYLLPLAAALLAVTLLTLAYRAKSRRGYVPLGIGLAAAVLVLLGKFALRSDPLMYVGVTVLLIASGWNAWPVKKAGASSCPVCAQQEPVLKR